ncbi:molybdate ABC transporter substrate-binding protein [Cryobacterium sp. AP23]
MSRVGRTSPRTPKRRSHGPARIAILATAVVLALAGCAAPAGSDGNTEGTGTPAPADAVTLTVFAAASLTGTFTDIADRFEAEHPGLTVALNFAGSADLVSQISEGAPADVIATADSATMATLADDGLLADAGPIVFATNTLEIAVPPDNPAGIRSFADLAQAGLNLVVCAPQVPCGKATAAVATAADVELTPVSEENSVTDVLGKVTSGEADAGLVYVTDVAAAGADILGIPFDEATEAVNEYPIATVSGSARSRLAADFTRFVTGDAGQAVFAEAGFGAP